MIHLAWSPDGAVLASGSWDRSIRLWRPAGGRPGPLLQGHGARISALAWSPRGTTLASAAEDGEARLWDVRTGAALHVPHDRGGVTAPPAWSPDDRLLATGGTDGRVRVWDPSTGDRLAAAHCLSSVADLRFAADGRLLRAADDGAATANRPIPYAFELTGLNA